MCGMARRFSDQELLKGYLVRSARNPDYYELVVERDRPGILEKISQGIKRICSEREKSGKIYEVSQEVAGYKKQLRAIVRTLNAEFLAKKAA